MQSVAGMSLKLPWPKFSHDPVDTPFYFQRRKFRVFGALDQNTQRKRKVWGADLIQYYYYSPDWNPRAVVNPWQWPLCIEIEFALWQLAQWLVAPALCNRMDLRNVEFMVSSLCTKYCTAKWSSVDSREKTTFWGGGICMHCLVPGHCSGPPCATAVENESWQARPPSYDCAHRSADP